MKDMISRQSAIDVIAKLLAFHGADGAWIEQAEALNELRNLPSVQAEEIVPHRNYQYLSDYWCECGWHLGKKESVKYCAECGKKVKWDERFDR